MSAHAWEEERGGQNKRGRGRDREKTWLREKCVHVLEACYDIFSCSTLLFFITIIYFFISILFHDQLIISFYVCLLSFDTYYRWKENLKKIY